uniref:Metallothionein n=1 Tax=Equus asinus TaxID=9793 RepID=A0A9L0J821_EQUAS
RDPSKPAPRNCSCPSGGSCPCSRCCPGKDRKGTCCKKRPCERCPGGAPHAQGCVCGASARPPLR